MLKVANFVFAVYITAATNIRKSVRETSVKWKELISPSPEALQGALDEFLLGHLDSAESGQLFPRFEESAERNSLVLRSYRPRPVETDSMNGLSEGLQIYFSADRLLLVHEAGLEWLRPLLDRWGKQSPHGELPVVALVRDLLLEVVFSYETPLDEIEAQIDGIEADVFRNENVATALKQIYDLKVKLSILNRIHRLTIDVIGKMGIRFEAKKSMFKASLSEAEASYQFSGRMLDNLHALVNVQLSLASHRTNETMRVLTLFSVVFMPLTFIVGIYGMNFQHMPELSWRFGYPAVMLVMLLVTWLSYAWFRRKGWV
jgi:magnesium transporter